MTVDGTGLPGCSLALQVRRPAGGEEADEEQWSMSACFSPVCLSSGFGCYYYSYVHLQGVNIVMRPCLVLLVSFLASARKGLFVWLSYQHLQRAFAKKKKTLQRVTGLVLVSSDDD